MNSLPTIFHITHVKSGSQWVYKILDDCAPERIVKPRVKVAQFYVDPILTGKIYPTVYVPHDRFEATLRPQSGLGNGNRPPSPQDPPAVLNYYNFAVLKQPIKSFVVIRDLRDTLVSLYFSLKVSHSISSENVAEGRQVLNQMSEEDGLLFIIEKRGQASATIQRSWLHASQAGDARLIRYEDLIANEQKEFAKIIEYCQIDTDPAKLAKIVDKNSFTNLAGRKPGDEDISSHYRKGVSGDWKNRFTDRIKSEFKKKFGPLLIETRYEKDSNW